MEIVDKTAPDDLIELVLKDENIQKALDQVVGNKGAPGVDGMTVYELQADLPLNVGSLKERIRNGKYRPQPVKRVEIPKPNGGTRNLGIPTCYDRLVQQMIAQVLVPIFDPGFSDHSYGFRPNRSAQDAIMEVKDYYEQGYTTAVSIDLSKYFDTIPQDILMNFVREKVKDKVLIDLVKRFLRSGAVMPDGLRVATDEGSPQGGPLSPLLSNIYLDRFDKVLEERGHAFVRYADDSLVLTRSQRAGERVFESCTQYLEKKLKLKVNREKSSIGDFVGMKYLGFTLVEWKDGVRIAPHPSSVERFKERTRAITGRYRGIKLSSMVSELRRYTKGWINYFGIGPGKSFFEELDSHLRRRVRAFILNQWKTPGNRLKRLCRLGNVPKESKLYKKLKGICYGGHFWRDTMDLAINRIMNNRYLDGLGMHFLCDDILEVELRCSNRRVPNGPHGGGRGRQTTLSEFGMAV
ncbi:MAG: group II intron reverse transcriptase/maturase [archaeon]|nr:group II intron reverse transcriptase/maturase [archaeon]